MALKMLINFPRMKQETYQAYQASFKKGQMGPFQLSDHVLQKANDALRHIEITKVQIWRLCVTCPSASFAFQFGGLIPRDRSAAKGPLSP